MRATRLVSLVVPLLVVPGLAAAQSRSFTYERGINMLIACWKPTTRPTVA